MEVGANNEFLFKNVCRFYLLLGFGFAPDPTHLSSSTASFDLALPIACIHRHFQLELFASINIFKLELPANELELFASSLHL